MPAPTRIACPVGGEAWLASKGPGAAAARVATGTGCAIDTLDIPMITGAVLVAAVFMVVMSFLVDVAYAIVDPRVRLSR